MLLRTRVCLRIIATRGPKTDRRLAARCSPTAGGRVGGGRARACRRSGERGGAHGGSGCRASRSTGAMRSQGSKSETVSPSSLGPSGPTSPRSFAGSAFETSSSPPMRPGNGSQPRGSHSGSQEAATAAVAQGAAGARAQQDLAEHVDVRALVAAMAESRAQFGELQHLLREQDWRPKRSNGPAMASVPSRAGHLFSGDPLPTGTPGQHGRAPAGIAVHTWTPLPRTPVGFGPFGVGQGGVVR